ncbi:MAG: MBL fold metallo-hydrolase [Pseudomonadales bacterium]|nr:MBL fold metallo-hydrolase [Pseudomonadales bacterium]
MNNKKTFICLTLIVACLQLPKTGQAQATNDNDDPAIQRVAPFQVFDNLYYIGAKWVAAWLLVSDQGLIVFDSLYGDLTDIAIDGIRELGFDPNDIRYLVITHAHYDHVGGARRFQDEFSPVVMMTEQDWQMTTQPAEYREYPTPVRHLSATTGGVINLGRTRVHFMQTPGHTPGVLSAFFTVYDDGYPHTAFLFGGAGLNFSGVERTETYIDSIRRIQKITDIEVNIPNHPGLGDVFERYQQLQNRQEGEPHPFVDPEGFYNWMDELLANAEAKLERERAAAN